MMPTFLSNYASLAYTQSSGEGVLVQPPGAIRMPADVCGWMRLELCGAVAAADSKLPCTQCPLQTPVTGNIMFTAWFPLCHTA